MTLDYMEHGDRIPEGDRNNRLFKACCDLAGCGFDCGEAQRLCGQLAAASGLPDGEVAKTIASAYSARRTPSRSPSTNSFSPRPQVWQHAARYIEAGLARPHR